MNQEMNQEMKPTSDSDQKKLEGALDTIAEVLVRRDLESVRRRVNALESTLTERIDSVGNSTTDAIDKVTKDLASRVDGLVTKLDEAEGRQTVAIARAKKETATDLDKREEQMKQELASLTAGLSAVQLELQQQMLATERISGVINNMATAFSVPPVAAAPPPMVATEENLDDALGQMFDSPQPEMDSQADPETRNKR